MDSAGVRSNEEIFNAELWKRFKSGKIRNVYPFKKYRDIVGKIKTLEDNPPCNTPGEYYLLRKFIVVKVNGRERLSNKPENATLKENKSNSNRIAKYYVALEEIYTILEEAHRWIKHGCRDKLLRKIQSQGIVNITRETVELFLSLCNLCRPRKSPTQKHGTKRVLHNSQEVLTEYDSTNIISVRNDYEEAPAVSNNIINTNLNQNKTHHHTVSFTRGFVDLIDFTETPDGEYRYVFVYLDIQTCFCVLYPVRCKCTYEVVKHLLNVFTLFGAPQVLHSNFTDAFLSSIIHDIKKSLSEIVLAVGSRTYSALQEVAQSSVTDVKSSLKLWMIKHDSKNWSFGLSIVQLERNIKCSSTGTKSPYECFFGRPISNMSNISRLKSAEKEEELLSLMNGIHSLENQPYEHMQVSLDPDVCSLVQNNNHSSSEFDIEDEISPIVKIETSSDAHDSEGCEISDSSNEICTSPSSNLKIVIKQEPEECS